MNGRDIDSAVLIALQRLEKLTPKRKEILLSFGALPSALLREELRQKVTVALGESATDFFRFVDERESYFDSLAAKGIGWVTYLDDEYPETLSEIDIKPVALFFKGNAALLKSFSIAIVGTRRPTRYGARIAAHPRLRCSGAGWMCVIPPKTALSTTAYCPRAGSSFRNTPRALTPCRSVSPSATG